MMWWDDDVMRSHQHDVITSHCEVLQCIAVCCSTLQYVAVCCCVLRCVAVCCSVLQCMCDEMYMSSHHHRRHPPLLDYGVATSSRLLKIISFFGRT